MKHVGPKDLQDAQRITSEGFAKLGFGVVAKPQTPHVVGHVNFGVGDIQNGHLATLKSNLLDGTMLDKLGSFTDAKGHMAFALEAEKHKAVTALPKPKTQAFAFTPGGPE